MSKSFPLFLVVWNQMQNQSTPDVHLRIAHWLQARWKDDDKRLLLMAFRSCGKSTIVGLFAAWILWCDPNLRIIVLAADASLAGKMVRNTRRIIERHPLTSYLRPDRPDQWASNRFTVKRTRELRDASMVAFGIGANVTGSRADVVICDDVEVPNTCDTPDKRQDLRDRLAEIAFILTAQGTQLYVGTPHAFHTIYATEKSDEPDAPEPFLNGFDDLRVPILKDDGASAWPERFSMADIESIKRSGGPRRFGAQMMLQAQPIEESRLNVDALQWYDADIIYNESQGKPTLHIGGIKMVSASAWWDPAFGHGGDGSVVAVLFGDADGDYWLHHLKYIRVRQGAEEDEATQQCRQVAALCHELHLSSITLEINGIGRFLPAILRRELAGMASVVEVSNRRPKNIRIIEAFDAVLAAGALRVHKSIAQTSFMEEMRSWHPSAKGHDDGIDAVAGALSQQPVRVGVKRFSKRNINGWQQGAHSHTARTNFDVME